MDQPDPLFPFYSYSLSDDFASFDDSSLSHNSSLSDDISFCSDETDPNNHFVRCKENIDWLDGLEVSTQHVDIDRYGNIFDASYDLSAIISAKRSKKEHTLPILDEMVMFGDDKPDMLMHLKYVDGTWKEGSEIFLNEDGTLKGEYIRFLDKYGIFSYRDYLIFKKCRGFLKVNYANSYRNNISSVYPRDENQVS